nr:hypothetical protein [uncultured Campylobacter sp.]
MIKFPPLYLKFLEDLGDEECIDVFNESGAGAYLYGSATLTERNETYEVALYEPGFYMIGQDGDLGFFIKLNSDDAIYFNDLGALGSAPMRLAERDIFAFIKKIKEGGEIFS